jgi:hypothetical protein
MKTSRAHFGPRSVDLDQLAKAVTPTARLMQPPFTLTPRGPDSCLRHPLAQCLLTDRELMAFNQLLSSERRAEIRIMLADQFQGELTDVIDDPIVGSSATSFMPQRCCAVFQESLQQPLNLARRDIEEAGGRSAGHSSLNDLRKHLDTLQLAFAHQHQVQDNLPHSRRRGAWQRISGSDIPTLLNPDILT